jgi:hypothetical protein
VARRCGVGGAAGPALSRLLKRHGPLKGLRSASCADALSAAPRLRMVNASSVLESACNRGRW